MGVPGFNTWMRKEYVGAYVPQSNEFDHVYVDMASVLHAVLRRGVQPPGTRVSLQNCSICNFGQPETVLSCC